MVEKQVILLHSVSPMNESEDRNEMNEMSKDSFPI
jgi:hypothetical protein